MIVELKDKIINRLGRYTRAYLAYLIVMSLPDFIILPCSLNIL